MRPAQLRRFAHLHPLAVVLAVHASMRPAQLRRFAYESRTTGEDEPRASMRPAQLRRFAFAGIPRECRLNELLQ